MKGKKTGGRQKGTPNKLDSEAREVFIQTLEGQVPNIEKAFQEVLKKSPEKYLDLFAKYAQYFVPKKTESDIKTEVSGTFDFNETIRKLREND
jgi:hypothetical protein